MQQVRRVLTAVLIACSVAVGCQGWKPSVERSLLVGRYEYHSEDPEERQSDHEWDHLILRADGDFTLIKGGPTKTRSELRGRWQLDQNGLSGPVVLAGQRSYPVHLSRTEVRLMIDNDAGIWYTKPLTPPR